MPSPPGTADGLPWRFVPTQRSVKLHPGQSTLAFYTAHNRSDKAITGGTACGWGQEHPAAPGQASTGCG